jgi:hypothetical protein
MTTALEVLHEAYGRVIDDREMPTDHMILAFAILDAAQNHVLGQSRLSSVPSSDNWEPWIKCAMARRGLTTR